jgi:PncC family amidohydrolase
MERVQTAVHNTTVDALALAAELGERLRERAWQLAVAESCTGGLIGHRITSISGSSDYFAGGVIAYSNSAKEQLLGVAPETLARVGAVSRETALEMAHGARRALEADVGIASTGIAGPGGATARKPVGLVYLAVSTPDDDEVIELHLDGDRLAVIEASANAALQLALGWLGPRYTHP